MNNQQNITFWQIILQIGSISGLATLFYTIAQNLKKRPRFKIDPRSSWGSSVEKDGALYAELIFNVYVKNQSVEENTLTNIHYVVWRNPKKRTRTLSFGGNPKFIVLNPESQNKKDISLPLSFRSNESKYLRIVFEIRLTGSHEEKIFLARERTGNFYDQKYIYKLLFKDTKEHLFDDLGNLRSQELINAWWMIPGTYDSMKSLNIFPYLYHLLKIGWIFSKFQIRRSLYFMGF